MNMPVSCKLIPSRQCASCCTEQSLKPDLEYVICILLVWIKPLMYLNDVKMPFFLINGKFAFNITQNSCKFPLNSLILSKCQSVCHKSANGNKEHIFCRNLYSSI